MPDRTELRKVQVTGGSTFVISLPKPWATAHNLRNGDRLAIRAADDGSLTIRVNDDRAADVPALEIDATKLGETALLRRLLGGYLAGHDVFVVTGRPRLSHAQRNVVRRFSQICIGPEIVEETGDRVLVRDLVNPAEFTLTSAVNRVHLIAQSMIRDALVVVQTQDADLARDVQARDDEVDRLHRLVAKRFARLLSSGVGARDQDVGLLDAQRLHQVSRLIERCADHASNVARLGQQLPAKGLQKADRDRLVQLGKRAVALLEDALNSFKRRDDALANRVIDASAALVAEKAGVRESFYGMGAALASTLTLIIESLERIHQYASDIAEVALNAPRGAAVL